jgi:hypothetical protein
VTALRQSEKQHQAAIIELARRFGWHVAHFHDSRRQITDRRTGEPRLIGDGDAQGFPDLVLVRREHLIFAELKAQNGCVKPEQQVWLDALKGVKEEAEHRAFLIEQEFGICKPHIEVYTWRPSDWPQIERILR